MIGDARTLSDLVDGHARTQPDHPALRVEDETLTYGQLAAQVRLVAAGLAENGVCAGQTVAFILSNSIEFVIAWLALSRIGAVAAPVNTALLGGGLAAALRTCGAEVAIVDKQFLPALEEALLNGGSLRMVFVRGHAEARTDAVPIRPWEDLTTHPSSAPRHETRPADPSILLFTSGSTGRSKACVLPHRYVLRQAEVFTEQLGLTAADVLFCPFPLFHADAAIFTVAPAFMLGATAALVERFSVRRFWEQVRHYQATVFDFMGATLTMLHKQEAAPDDADNPARLGWGVPLPEWAGDFERRFGVELVEVYGLSDTGIVLYNRPGEPRRPGSCGRPVHPFDVKVLDPDGLELPSGEVGEICIRPLEPHVILSEYLGMPEVTVQTWRDLWFHTGDLARRDEDGYFYFVGRGADVIRRRGENISALEIEAVISRHPAVLEVAAFGVPSDLTEEDVMVVVSLRVGGELDERALLSYCDERLPRHMLPRYVEFTGPLPKTPTEKIEKRVLKSCGVGPFTFDRETRD
ncbi:AMP-binding protein [Nonomuraea sp. NEAU-A123]|uniref:AMP-binding protein n=1 Tax=Nonomuraea sp. NEAU-A123 TaxID=2839649 RepID=UPI001BE3D2A4|nr:AMP-binding protein [Nonomuraea sp. NEAU-A123]MBT2227973.1 AMP-binding protein [Nonomuraea sp. NEAU-A123]